MSINTFTNLRWILYHLQKLIDQMENEYNGAYNPVYDYFSECFKYSSDLFDIKNEYLVQLRFIFEIDLYSCNIPLVQPFNLNMKKLNNVFIDIILLRPDIIKWIRLNSLKRIIELEIHALSNFSENINSDLIEEAKINMENNNYNYYELSKHFIQKTISKLEDEGISISGYSDLKNNLEKDDLKKFIPELFSESDDDKEDYLYKKLLELFTKEKEIESYEDSSLIVLFPTRIGELDERCINLASCSPSKKIYCKLKVLELIVEYLIFINNFEMSPINKKPSVTYQKQNFNQIKREESQSEDNILSWSKRDKKMKDTLEFNDDFNFDKA